MRDRHHGRPQDRARAGRKEGEADHTLIFGIHAVEAALANPQRVIAKLYLLDVWDLGRGFRITAFMALGVLLLLVSYLYSRFKPALERLWKDSTPPHP